MKKEETKKSYEITKDCCPYCESKNIYMNYLDHDFQIFPDNHPSVIILRVNIPVIHCKSCEYFWLNYLADEIMGKAQKKYMESLENMEKL